MTRGLCSFTLGLIFLVATLATPFANASLIFDPYLGYGAGQIKLKYAQDFPSVSLQGTSDTGRADGFVYGARAGFLYSDFLITAFEYQGITGTQKMKSLDHDDSFTQETMYASLGYRTPFGIRFIGSYGFNTKIKIVPSGGGQNTDITGTAYKMLIGYLVPRVMSINVEYAIYNIKKITAGGIAEEKAHYYSNYDYSRTMVTVSLPFRFF